MRRRGFVRSTANRHTKMCKRCGLEPRLEGEQWGPNCIANQQRRLIERVQSGYSPEEIMADEGEGLDPRDL